MITVQIEACKKEHAAAIAEICATGWQQTVQGLLSEEYQIIAKEEWYNVERVQSEIDKGIYKYCAIVDDKIVGAIGGMLTEYKISWIWVFYIDENYRYQGIGHQLLKQFTTDHQVLGAKEQWLTVLEGNMRAIPFYRSNGFEPIERIVKKTKTNEDEIVWTYKRSI